MRRGDPSVGEGGVDSLESGGGSSSTTSGSMYIGVPDDWQPRTRGRLTGDPRSQYEPGLPNPNANLYKPGDELNEAPVGEPGRWALQQQMAMVGLLDIEDITPGIWDADTRKAFEELLGIANTMGVSYQTALTRMAEAGGVGAAAPEEAGGAGTEGGLEAPPLVLNPSDPKTLADIADRSAMEIYGRHLTDEEKMRFVTGFLAFEEGAQRKQYDIDEAAAQGEEGLSNVPSRDPALFMEEALEKTNPKEATAKKGADAIMEVVNFMKTGSFT